MKSHSEWTSFCPELHISDANFLTQQTVFDADKELLTHLRNNVITEGYFELPKLEWSLPIPEMAGLVTKLRKASLPTPFAFVYDEFWIMFFRLHRILLFILGDYKKLPDFWVWHIDPSNDESGWAPHRDKTRKTLNSDGSPNAFTVWIPLSDSTTLNGCMYILPADRDPVYNTENEREWKVDFASIRALPAQAGAVLGWNQAVLHWGSRSSERAKFPRISVALEFQSSTRPALNSPLMDPGYFPSFEERIKLIAKQILQYRHMYPLLREHEKWAESV